MIPIITEDAQSEQPDTETTESTVTDSDMSDFGMTDHTEDVGYDLPIEDEVRKQAEEDCIQKMEDIRSIYTAAEKGKGVNVYIDKDTAGQMLDCLQETGQPVTANRAYMNMRNYEPMEAFLQASQQGKYGKIVLYEIHLAGGVGRKEFLFDGTDMYVLDVIAVWNKAVEPVISYISYDRIKEWEYTPKGWFSYEYCVKEPPEVTEIIIGEVLMRVKPQPEEYNEIGEAYLYPIGYQGNNLFITSWDVSAMEHIDFPGLFEYLYGIAYAEPFPADDYISGIPKAEFESLLMQYLPVSQQQLYRSSAFDEQTQKYRWNELNCGNYDPGFFGTAVPEIVEKQENADGTVTFLIDAVCEMMGDDRVMQHRLTVAFPKEGGIRYLKNEVLEDGSEHIPRYQYRVSQ